MKKIFIFLLLIAGIALIAPQLSYATITRDKGLGLDQYEWMVDGLQSNVYKRPAYLSSIKNTIFFERIGIEGGINMGGITWNPGGIFNIAILTGDTTDSGVWNSTAPGSLLHMGDYTSQANDYGVFYDASDPPEPQSPSGNAVSLITPTGYGGYQTVENYREQLTQKDVSVLMSLDWGLAAVGLKLGYGSAWSENEYKAKLPLTESDQYSFLNSQFEVGLSFAMKVNAYFDFSVNATGLLYVLENSYSEKIAAGNLDLNYASNLSFDVLADALFNIKINDTHKLHIMVGYGYLNRGTTGSGSYSGATPFDIDETFNRSGHDIKFGISDEIHFSKNIMGFVGAYVNVKLFESFYTGSGTNDGVNVDDSYKNNTMIIDLPLIIGVEVKIIPSLTGRFGFSYHLYNPTYEDITLVQTPSTDLTKKNYSDNSSTTSINLGLTYKWGDLRIDWLVNVDLFLKGPDFISGAPSSTSTYYPENDLALPMAMAVSISYNFSSIMLPSEGIYF